MKHAGFFQEENGSRSVRRLLATLFSILFFVISIYAMPYASSGWWVFIPSILCVVAVVLLLFFTTWNDITALANAIKKDGKEQ